MAYDIQQSTTQSALLFFLVASSDHISALTGATPTVTLSKNGAAFASPSGTVSEIANGWYKVAGNATDTATLGPLALHATAASADPCDILVANIVAYNPQNANIGLTNVSSNMVQVAGAAVSTTSAQIGVAVVSYASGQAPVQPTVAGRTLDISTNGNAGIDWANIDAPTTTQGLTGTTISTTQAVASVSGSVGSVTGAVGSVTGNVGGNVVGSVASVAGAVGSVTGNVGGNVTGSVGSVAAAVTVSGTSALTEVYAAQGSPFTLASALYGINQMLNQKAISGTTVTVKKRDGSTTAKTFTLDSATTPTTISETT